MQAFTGANFWSAAPSAMIDLTGEGGSAAVLAALTARGALERQTECVTASNAVSYTHLTLPTILLV